MGLLFCNVNVLTTVMAFSLRSIMCVCVCVRSFIVFSFWGCFIPALPFKHQHTHTHTRTHTHTLPAIVEQDPRNCPNFLISRAAARVWRSIAVTNTDRRLSFTSLMSQVILIQQKLTRMRPRSRSDHLTRITQFRVRIISTECFTEASRRNNSIANSHFTLNPDWN